MGDDIKKWPLGEKKVLLKNKIFDVVSLQTVSPKNGNPYTFFRIECSPWVNILPLTEDDQVVLVKQYRAGTDSISLEIPGGLMENGEKPMEAAVREMLEETGYTTHTDNLISLGYILPNPAIQNNKCYLFAAENVFYSGKRNLDESEDIEVVLVDYRRFLQMINEGEINHSLVLNTVLKYDLFKNNEKRNNIIEHTSIVNDKIK